MTILTTLLSTLGSAGFGSILKIVSGFFDSCAAAKADRIRLERAEVLTLKKVDLEYQKALFGNTAAGASGLLTRRIIAIMMTSAFLWLMVWCSLHPDAVLTTVEIPESKTTGSLLWGLYEWTPHNKQTMQLTMGHVIILGMNQIGLMTGFYFTPGGRK